ncbi:GNAT family N-acetyltransferase [Treponema sp. Marseille-Q3903]|uniref:GNAT family N-acetyltransferase n=1 Tax=Treponema sp. Marseille-Q3903 TaxID=2766703 RepID=UPI001651BA24|nr:GNAT family N-acetyltransferase [Treponema sp. Marseille-Q3903]MBC6713301.1 GNAT family N-acetyltransferase [Treponema sp. Marseille-Q3903]
MNIRRAEKKDTGKILKLLGEVLEIHSKIRPDIFISGTTKYTENQLAEKFNDDKKPVFVATDDNDEVLGYVFCIFLEQPFSTNMHQFTTLFIDDLCVDQNARGRQIGKKLYQHVLKFAKEKGCYDVTLNVWEGNDNARAFYEKMGMFVKETQMEVIL